MTELEDVLAKKDVVIIIDRSGSMTLPATGGLTRWDSAKESVFAVAAAAEKFDTDGLEVYLFNDDNVRFENVTSAQVYKIFEENEPIGTTALGEVLQVSLSNYFERKKLGHNKEGAIFLVATDGAPDNPKKVFQTIVEATNQVDHDKEIGISFIQVGDDKTATAFLQELDDELVSQHGAKYDIVDTVNIADIGNRPLKEVLLNALVD